MKREQTKIYRKESETADDGGFWELFLFAILFVVVFSVIARTAHAAPLKSRKSAKPAALAQAVSEAPAAVSEAPAAASSADMIDDAKPIHPQGQSAAIPSNALPDANISTRLAEPPSDQPGFASKVTVETSRTVSADDEPNYGGWYQIATGYSIPKQGLAFGVSVGWFQNYSKEKDDHTNGDLDNPVLTASKTWKEGVHFKSSIFDSITAGVSSVAGTSHESARRTFIANVGPSIGAAKAIRKLHIGQTFAYARGFYNYDIRDDGTVNSPNVLKSKTDLSYDLTEKLALSLSTALSYAISFQNVGKTTELSSISLDYSPTDKIGFSAGVSTERGTQAADGLSNRIALFQQDVAQAFLDMSLSF